MSIPIVAVVGAEPPLSEASRGIMRLCGFVVVEAPSLDHARDLVRHGPAPTFVVIMSRRLAGNAEPEEKASLAAFLDAVRPTVMPDHVIAVSRKGVSPDSRRRYEPLGIRVFPARNFSFRLLARFLIDLQGGDGACCCRG